MDLAERKKDLLKEIDLIQSIINRMSNTSFLIKGWAVTMISFIFAFRTNQAVLPLVFIPLFLFWFLDSYFLQQERLYRKLYQWVIENRMTDDSHLFSLNAARFGKESIFKAMFSITLGMFYGVALSLIIVVIFFLPYI